MSDAAPKKRSRFDQTEPQPRKASRFDRRSRSPADRKSESRRSRSPLNRGSRSPVSEQKSSVPSNAAAAAAAAAAKINAQLQAKKGIQHVDVPAIQSPSDSASTPAKPITPSAGLSTDQIDGDIYIADGDYIKDIEINDLRNRYTLTKSSTQKMIKEETGADITTRGEYVPDRKMASAAKPPLYLHITSTSKAGLEMAISKIEDLMQQELPNLVDERRFRKQREPEYERDELGRRKWPEAKISIDMESIPGFNLRAQVVGQGGQYVKHIQQETRCRVQIKGRGSGFMEHSTGQESDEPMYLHVASPDVEAVEKARQLCEDLLGSIRQNYEHFKANPPQRVESYTDGYGADAPRGSYGGYGRGGGGGGRNRESYSSGYDNNQQNQSNSYNSPYAGTPATPAPGTAGSPTEQDYTAQYAQYYASQPGGDPYAAYGGYQAYVQAYQAYYQQYQQPAQAAPQDGSAPPPPPPDAGSGAPPPPPDAQGYNAVPPPPGM